jgi:hypothetical protein
MMILDVINNKKNITLSFLIIFFVGLGIRIFYLSPGIPLVSDGMDNFTYATAINHLGHLPTEWTPPNIGWPLFLSFWFSVFSFENTLQYMQLQKLISIVASSLTIIPIFSLCRKFFDEKLSLIGISLFIFDPRIIANSLLGITESMFILLGITSLVTFLKYDRKWIILSFICAGFTSIIRAEGIFIFFTLIILFLIKYRISKEVLKTLIPCLLIFFMILTPVMYYKIEVTGNDAMFQRVAYGTNQIFMNNQEDNNEILKGIELFIKYLGWIMIPTFVIFVPYGIYEYFKRDIKDKNFIIVYLIVVSFPILYAYIMQAQDTRYLYILYPIFSLLSLFAVKRYISKISNKKVILSILVIGIFSSSIGFYEFKNSDYKNEIELNEIAKIVSNNVKGLNYHPLETKYIRAAEIPNDWPFIFKEENYEIKIIPTDNYQDLEEYILNSKDELTHLIVDDNTELPEFLQEIYYNYHEYQYLQKIFDSKENGFDYHIILFEINFEEFNSKGK